jgi:hypothetical protein
MSSTKLPNNANAYIQRNKITGYLLSETHAIGKSKAKFFRSLGFDDATAEQLEQELLAIAHAGQVKESVSSPHGTKYVMDGLLRTPHGVTVHLWTIWIIDAGEENPRFVTAYPIE